MHSNYLILLLLLIVILDLVSSYSLYTNRLIKHSSTNTPRTLSAVTESVDTINNDYELVTHITSKLAVYNKKDKESNNCLINYVVYRMDDDKKPITSNAVITSKIYQETNGPVPRSYLPSLLVISCDMVDDDSKLALIGLMEESLCWYSDAGGRVAHIDVAVPCHLKGDLITMGFESIDNSDGNKKVVVMEDKRKQLQGKYLTDSDATIMRSTALKLQSHCLSRLAISESDSATNNYSLNNLIGRLMHDAGNPKDSIDYYTRALTINPESAVTFRNLGSAYAAVGNMQMAFASYQQAVQLDQEDSLVYLKLAFFYEGFAAQDWPEAESHAQRCYNYYLDNVDPEDTAILTRLANLLTTETDASQAVDVYDRIIALDDSIVTVWFNRAHAQIKIKDYEGATESLKRAIALDDSLVAAKHMIKALDEDLAIAATSVDEAYVKDLFNEYAPIYDKQIKKLLYAAPRVIRQELAKIYQSRYSIRAADGTYVIDHSKIQALQQQSSYQKQEGSNPHGCESDTDTSFIDAAEVIDKEVEAEISEVVGKEMAKMSQLETTTGVGSSCTSYTSFMNHTLDVLDLGCGTGMAGSWLKDYAASLTGVDISTEMIAAARKKGLYQNLYEMSLSDFFESYRAEQEQRSKQGIDVVRGSTRSGLKDFDVVVAAEVLSYVGDLRKVFKEVSTLMRSQGLFAFTVEAADSATGGSAPSGFRLLKSGRFGYCKDYIDVVITEMGASFKVILSREFSPRLDMGEPVPGYLYIVQKD